MDIQHISISRHGVWNECQERYKFQYHLKTPIAGPQKPYFAYGKLVHRIAELYVASKDPDSFNEIVSDVVGGRVEIEPGEVAPKLDAEYTRKLVVHLKNLREFTTRVGFDVPGYTEYQFRYDLLPPKEYFATGFIDRIMIRGDKYFIIDYKTTKKGPWRKNNLSVLTDLQLRTYANVVRKEFGIKPENIHCCLYYLEGGNIVGATYNRAALENAEKDLLDAYIQIKGMDPEDARGNVGDHCRRCDFKNLCKFYSLT